MAHYAKLGIGNIVEKVEVVSNDIATTEQAGADFLKNLHKDPYGIYIQTSYNSNFRKNFAGKGFNYDEIRNAFIPPKVFNSWILNEDTCRWEAPIPIPDNINSYEWNEETKSWDLVE